MNPSACTISLATESSGWIKIKTTVRSVVFLLWNLGCLLYAPVDLVHDILRLLHGVLLRALRARRTAEAQGAHLPDRKKGDSQRND